MGGEIYSTAGRKIKGVVMKKRKLGFAFFDEIGKITFKTRHFNKGEVNEGWKESLIPNFDPDHADDADQKIWFTVAIAATVIALFFIIFLRLFHLQIVQGTENRELADGNRIQIKIIHAPRGVIFDRNGEVLVANSPAFRVVNKANGKTKFITREEAIELQVKGLTDISRLEVDNVRNYPKKEILAHVLGYVGQISSNELKDFSSKNYRPSDVIGKSGIEAEYEDILRGVDGGEIIEVDSTGKKIRTLRINPAVPGKDIYLTIDMSLQEVLFKQLKGMIEKSNVCCGGAVVAEVRSGEILALVSFPGFDPNIFTKGSDDQFISGVFSSDEFPLLNRVTAGTYPPGSTFKIISSLAVLNSNKINKDTTFEDTGVMSLGPYKFANWYFTEYGRTEGSVNLIKAIKRSNDIYYYRVGEILGEKALIDWSKKLKLGIKSGIDLPGEAAGLVPDNEWKEKTYGQVWYPGDTLHMAIGQGFLLTTPLQVLDFTSFIAGSGTVYKPHIFKKAVVGNKIVEQSKSEVLVSVITSEETIAVIKKGLAEVTVNGGTAWPFFTFPVATAGKTGTAEFGDPKNKTHAWYTAYAPTDKPEIVMTVLVEAGGEGSSVAAPVVKEVFRWYFSPDKNDLIKDIYPQNPDTAKSLGE